MKIHNSDHHLISVDLLTNISLKHQESVIARDMRKIRANPDYLVNSLREIKWDLLANMVWDVDEMVKFWTSSIIQCVNKVADWKEYKFKLKKYQLPLLH